MDAGATIGRMPHITDTQDTDATTPYDTDAGEPHGAGTRMWSGGQGSTGARAKITHQRPGRATQCATPTGLIIRMFSHHDPRICRYDLSDYRDTHMLCMSTGTCSPDTPRTDSSSRPRYTLLHAGASLPAAERV